MKILEVLTYYRPHVSGLTIYVERLSKALADAGHDVTILTSQYDKSLPRRQRRGRITVVRVPVIARLSKGVIMPTFGLQALSLVSKVDVVHLHLPQFDAPGVALLAQVLKKPVVLTYHSDLILPPGAFNRFVEAVVSLTNRAAGRLANAIVTYTRDFGEHSPFLARYQSTKLQIVPPPVDLESATTADIARFRQKHKLQAGPVIGIAARLAAEKGIEVLMRALPTILEVFPTATVLHAGPTEKVLGEEAYATRLAPLFYKHRRHYKLLGNLEGRELSAFYGNLDCLILCSLNNTETFGLVQIEAMISGAPVVASNLPGVRQPVRLTGMGEVVPVGDPQALAEAVIQVVKNKSAYLRDAAQIADAFSPAQTAREYVRLFEQLLDDRQIDCMQEPKAYSELRVSSAGTIDGVRKRGELEADA